MEAAPLPYWDYSDPHAAVAKLENNLYVFNGVGSLKCISTKNTSVSLIELNFWCKGMQLLFFTRMTDKTLD